MRFNVVLKSSIFRKFLVAVTGVLLFGFIIGHLAGNLGAFAGQGAFNDYAEFLKSKPALLWGARLGLLVTLGIHVILTWQITVENRQARPIGYRTDATRKASRASQVMIYSGGLLLVFLVFHLLHFTVGILPGKLGTYFTFEEGGRHDAYRMMVSGFSHGWVVLLYLGGMLVLGSHLSHGISSMIQTMGLKHSRYTCLIDCGGKALAALIFLGYAFIPIAVQIGILDLPPTS